MLDKAKQTRPTATKPAPSLVGMFFHSLDQDNRVQWQGQVHSQVADGFYLLRLFDWIVGADNLHLKLVSLQDMLGWQFYESAEDMRDWYEYHHQPLSLVIHCWRRPKWAFTGPTHTPCLMV